MSYSEFRELAVRDTEAALALANARRQSWARAQDLARVARYSPAGRIVTIAKAAVTAAAEADDPYIALYPTAWPLRALVERGLLEAAARMLAPLMGQAPAVEPMASRSEALFLIFQAVALEPCRLWPGVFEPLMAASAPRGHWRQGRNARDAILIVAGLDRERAHAAAERLEDPKLKRSVLRKLEAGETRPPRAFF